jgi:hypothetical protein
LRALRQATHPPPLLKRAKRRHDAAFRPRQPALSLWFDLVRVNVVALRMVAAPRERSERCVPV